MVGPSRPGRAYGAEVEQRVAEIGTFRDRGMELPSRVQPGTVASSSLIWVSVSRLMVTAYHSQMNQSAERSRQTAAAPRCTARLGETMTSFAGWQMPLRYASETAESTWRYGARRACSTSPTWGEIAVAGPEAGAALDYALTGNLSALRPGRARYTMICAEDGGVRDDLVCTGWTKTSSWSIANASNTDVVFPLSGDRSAGHERTVTDATGDYALVAIQGAGGGRSSSPRWPAAWTSARSGTTPGLRRGWPGTGPGWRGPDIPARYGF